MTERCYERIIIKPNSSKIIFFIHTLRFRYMFNIYAANIRVFRKPNPTGFINSFGAILKFPVVLQHFRFADLHWATKQDQH